MLNDRKVNQSLENLGKAIQRLREALQESSENSLIVDGTIQRFEFTFELFWKTLKRLLETEGIKTKTPRETLKQGYMIGWLHNEEAWLQMLRDRNETSHVYDEEKAREIYRNIKSYFPELENTFFSLKKQLDGKKHDKL